MQKAVYLSLTNKTLAENSSIEELFSLKVFNETWEMLLYMIDNPEVLLFIYQAHSDFNTNKKVLLTIFELNPVLPVIMLQANQAEMEQYYDLNKNITFADDESEVNKIYNKLKVMQRRHYRANWPLKVNVLLDLDQPTEGELLTLSAGGGYIKLTELNLVESHKKITLEIIFQDFSFMASAELVQIFANGQGHLPPGFSIKFIDVTETTQKYIEQIINTKIMSNIMSVFKDT